MTKQNDATSANGYDAGLPRFRVKDEVVDFQGLEKAVPSQEFADWGIWLTRLPDIWSDTQGEGVRVAVLDTGVDPDHPDLQDGIDAAEDFTGDGIEDANGHGTHCAGIVGARLNGVGLVGAAPRCRLLIGKVLDNQGRGSYRQIAAGIDWAVNQRADIVSLSLGGPESSDLLFRAVHRALSKGVFIVCAAGNEGSVFRNSIGYPGRYGSVITVAAHDRNGNASGFSSRGGEVDFMAPGEDIWSTYRDGTYAKLSGTSMATPFAAGVSALIVAKHKAQGGNTPVENVEDLRNHLLRMSAHPGHHDNERGYGPLLPFMGLDR